MEVPSGTPTVSIKAMDLDCRGADRVVTWVARTKLEYERGIELGMIAGWDSWEAYEAYFSELSANLQTPLVRLQVDPDEIASRLADLRWPNTPESRQRLYLCLNAEKTNNR